MPCWWQADPCWKPGGESLSASNRHGGESSFLNTIPYLRSSDAVSSFFMVSHPWNPVPVLTQQICLCIPVPIHSSSCIWWGSGGWSEELPVVSEAANPRYHIQGEFSVLRLTWTALDQCNLWQTNGTCLKSPLPGAAAGSAGKCEVGFADSVAGLPCYPDANQLGGALEQQNPNLHLRTGMGRKWYKPWV